MARGRLIRLCARALADLRAELPEEALEGAELLLALPGSWYESEWRREVEEARSFLTLGASADDPAGSPRLEPPDVATLLRVSGLALPVGCFSSDETGFARCAREAEAGADLRAREALYRRRRGLARGRGAPRSPWRTSGWSRRLRIPSASRPVRRLASSAARAGGRRADGARRRARGSAGGCDARVVPPLLGHRRSARRSPARWTPPLGPARRATSASSSGRFNGDDHARGLGSPRSCGSAVSETSELRRTEAGRAWADRRSLTGPASIAPCACASRGAGRRRVGGVRARERSGARGAPRSRRRRAEQHFKKTAGNAKAGPRRASRTPRPTTRRTGRAWRSRALQGGRTQVHHGGRRASRQRPARSGR